MSLYYQAQPRIDSLIQTKSVRTSPLGFAGTQTLPLRPTWQSVGLINTETRTCVGDKIVRIVNELVLIDTCTCLLIKLVRAALSATLTLALQSCDSDCSRKKAQPLLGCSVAVDRYAAYRCRLRRAKTWGGASLSRRWREPPFESSSCTPINRCATYKALMKRMRKPDFGSEGVELGPAARNRGRCICLRAEDHLGRA